MKVDISRIARGDIYAALRDRSAKSKSRFSKERDEERAIKERQNCLPLVENSGHSTRSISCAALSAEIWHGGSC